MLKPLSDKQILVKAINCFRNQKQRCYTKTNPRFSSYGAKGIKVEYSQDEFTDWFLKEFKKYKGIQPSVGRIDHLKNYSLDNIRFESLAENSLERINRVGTTRPRIKVLILDGKTNQKLMIAESIKEASSLTGVCHQHIPKYCNGTLKCSMRGYKFLWA